MKYRNETSCFVEDFTSDKSHYTINTTTYLASYGLIFLLTLPLELIGILGRSTCALVKKTEEIRERLERQRQLKFDRVWGVFEKDDFNDFNEAIALAGRKGAAWSNEAV